MKYWLVKSEPSAYSWEQFVKDGVAVWDGVRNHTAKQNMKMMSLGEEVLFYHSNEGKAIVGIAKVVTECYPDPMTPGEPWVLVDIMPSYALNRPVTLAEIKADETLAQMELVRQSRLSVCPVSAGEFERITQLSLVNS